MAANTTPIFTLTPVIGSALLSVANTNISGSSGTVETVITGSTDGTRINKITIKAIGTTTAGMVRLFIYDGTNTRLWKEILVTAITASGTVAAFENITILSGETALVLPYNYELRASTNNAESFSVVAEGANF